MSDPMIAAIAKLKTHSWGRFFFALPVVPANPGINFPTPCDVLVATESRVLLPDSAMMRSDPLYGAISWERYGLIGSLDYPGELIPLSVVKVHNPEFDYIKVLCSGCRREEYEGGVNGHLEYLRSIKAVS